MNSGAARNIILSRATNGQPMGGDATLIGRSDVNPKNYGAKRFIFSIFFLQSRYRLYYIIRLIHTVHDLASSHKLLLPYSCIVK